ncbi:PHP domain-containing protein [Candidatus Sumerlaeota bacterium]|nr:PHP domain-containing protein [Candidatus Sumerlaeota bacterium]
MASANRTYVGAIHIHSDQSDGCGSLREIVSAARQSGVDFVLLTDHGTRGYGARGEEGWHDGVLVLCGEEISTPDGHALAFETREDVGLQANLPAALAEVRRQVGVVVATHQHYEHGPVRPTPLEDADMIEAWSFTDEFLTRTSGRTLGNDVARADKFITGPSRALLRKWDRQLEKRRMPMIGGLNVHQRKQPLFDWKVMFPYAFAFQTIATCVQTPELPTVALRARDMIWSALREGRSFAVNRSLGPESNFQFYFAPKKGRKRLMGEDAPYDSGGRFHIKLPMFAEVVLRCNGQPFAWTTAQDMSFPCAGPGAYRVEVYLDRRMWILSNAIRLLDDGELFSHPTVSDVT